VRLHIHKFSQEIPEILVCAAKRSGGAHSIP
jgi:hypothetical protein